MFVRSPALPRVFLRFSCFWDSFHRSSLPTTLAVFLAPPLWICSVMQSMAHPPPHSLFQGLCPNLQISYLLLLNLIVAPVVAITRSSSRATLFRIWGCSVRQLTFRGGNPLPGSATITAPAQSPPSSLPLNNHPLSFRLFVSGFFFFIRTLSCLFASGPTRPVVTILEHNFVGLYLRHLALLRECRPCPSFTGPDSLSMVTY